jgi:hypothetical protein
MLYIFGQGGLRRQRRAQVTVIDAVDHLVYHVLPQVLGSAHAVPQVFFMHLKPI